jgi:hypothetical protein
VSRLGAHVVWKPAHLKPMIRDLDGGACPVASVGTNSGEGMNSSKLEHHFVEKGADEAQ